MSRNFIQNDQLVNEAALGVIRKAARTQDKDILAALDQNFGSPLRLFASNPSSAVLNIAAYEVQMADVLEGYPLVLGKRQDARSDLAGVRERVESQNLNGVFADVHDGTVNAVRRSA